MQTKKKILFISHEASFTGAPLVLYNLIEWLIGNNKDIEIHILFFEGGERIEEFKKLTHNVTILPDDGQSYLRLYNKFKKKIGLPTSREVVIKKFTSQHYEFIYANTVVSLEMAVNFKSSNSCKLLLHLHELEIIIQMLCPRFSDLAKSVDCFIAVSEAVKNNLTKRHNIDANKITLVHEFVTKEGRVKEVALNPKNKFKVGGCGSVNWRKGADLFVLVARRIIQLAPEIDIEFTWVGSIDRNNQLIFENDIEQMGLGGKVKFVGETNDPFTYFNEWDLFLMTSREDPFPLVCIELGKMGIPVLCFKNAGGTEEWIPKKASVPYLDIEEMAKSVIERINDKVLYKQEALEILNASREFSTSIQAPKISQLF